MGNCCNCRCVRRKRLQYDSHSSQPNHTLSLEEQLALNLFKGTAKPSPYVVAIVPGTGATNVVEKGWYAWLALELTLRGIKVYFPFDDMPDPIKSREEFWIPFLERLIGSDMSKCILVGHSTGGDAVLRLIEKHPVAGAVTVAAGPTWKDLDHAAKHEPGQGYYDRPWLWNKIRANAAFITQLHSTGDGCISIKVGRSIAANLLRAMDDSEMQTHEALLHSASMLQHAPFSLSPHCTFCKQFTSRGSSGIPTPVLQIFIEAVCSCATGKEEVYAPETEKESLVSFDEADDDDETSQDSVDASAAEGVSSAAAAGEYSAERIPAPPTFFPPVPTSDDPLTAAVVALHDPPRTTSAPSPTASVSPKAPVFPMLPLAERTKLGHFRYCQLPGHYGHVGQSESPVILHAVLQTIEALTSRSSGSSGRKQ